MGRTANLSIMGLYEWDHSLFDLMEIPTELDKEVLVMNLIAELAELEILYPNPVVLKNLIGVWSRKNLSVWQKLYETTQFDYNPIYNYNRMETGTDKGTGNDTLRNGGQDTNTTTTKSGHWVAGYDAGTPTATDDGLFKQSRDEAEGTSVNEYGKTESRNRSDNRTHELHAQGNIGVTTTQKLIKEERQIDLFNVYDIIIQDFKMRFCVMIY